VRAAVSPLGRARAAARLATSRAGTPERTRATARRRWLAAAAVMLAFVGLGVVASNWDTGSDDTATLAGQEGGTDEGSDEGGASDAAAEADDSGASEETTAPGDGLEVIVDLGDVDSSDALADRARSILADGFASPLAEGSGREAEAEQGDAGAAGFPPAACRDDAQDERLPAAPERVLLQGRATLDGEPVDVWVLDVDGEQRLVAVDASCSVVVDQPLED
ncbi:MAG: hypothetical protein ACRD07_16255, partial [Acidimicrobiales bacterium]